MERREHWGLKSYAERVGGQNRESEPRLYEKSLWDPLLGKLIKKIWQI